jgi:hypothetical protein
MNLRRVRRIENIAQAWSIKGVKEKTLVELAVDWRIKLI